ncbi:unnamed protein product [Clonostachys rosea]|uniref:FHA domain-containing protein n=1 Tax=Bionectria ochroleuca TaxID=29856 RepID=A0ABY6UV93_BIOOC|nr:unnamed protein product [Clonostachys rosea]
MNMLLANDSATIFAYHPRLWAYDLGESSETRDRFEVIKIRAATADSKKAKLFEIQPGGTNAGVEFSAEKCNVTDISRKYAVLHVGEMLVDGPRVTDQDTAPIQSIVEINVDNGQKHRLTMPP